MDWQIGSGTEWNDLNNQWQAEVKRLQARIAELEAERERVWTLWHKWYYHAEAEDRPPLRELMDAMNPEEEKQP